MIENKFKQFSKDGTLLTTDGKIDRVKLGAIVFTSKERLEALNQIVWPAIMKLFKTEITRLTAEGKKIIVLEAAVLFEAGMDSLCD